MVIETKFSQGDPAFAEAIQNAVIDAIITIDETGIIQAVNPATICMFGYSEEELLGHNVSMLMPDPDRANHDDYLAEYARTGVKKIIGIGREVTALDKNGKRFPADLTISAVFHEGRRYFTGILRDASERTKAQREIADYKQHLEELVEKRTRQLREARDEAERASAAKTRFLASASHDLRQPLQAANLLVYLLDGIVQDGKAREITEKLKRSMDSLGGLLNSLLDISRLYAGLITPQKKDFTLAKAFEHLGEEIRAIAENKGLDFSLVLEDTFVHSDPELLEQILRNLVYNAVKYTDHGSVRVRSRTSGNKVSILVEDFGPGIPLEDQELIFEEFFQLDNPSRNREKGLGLGLSIVRRLVQLLGIQLQLRSVPGEGSTFELIMDASDAAAVEAGSGQSVPATEVSPGQSVILIIEDDAQIREALAMSLRMWGFRVLSAVNEQEALDCVRQSEHKPNLILSDYRLGQNVTGDQVIRRLQEAIRAPVPALLITGDTSPGRLLQAKRSGFEILHKPIHPGELRTTVERILGTLADESQ